MTTFIHDEYLPFEHEVLRKHFARVPTPRAKQAGPDADPASAQDHEDRHLRYYESSAAANKQWMGQSPGAKPEAIDVQIEKDERFWVVTALLTAFYSQDRVAVLTELLNRSIGVVPPVHGVAPDGRAWSWATLLGATDASPAGDAQLFFEANLPAPAAYKKWLGQHSGRVLSTTLRDLASRTSPNRLEGATKADAVLVVPSTGLCIVFEAKVNSDISTSVRFDVLRNQLARAVDVMLEPPSTDLRSTTDESLRARRPERTFLVLLTPRIFQENPGSRLYGHLLPLYQSRPELLAQDLQHRADVDWPAVARRLGWLTWEDCTEVLPDSLPWLPRPAQ